MNEQAQEVEQKTGDNGRDYEAEARVQGWVGADEFKGDPEKHKSAQEFVELGEQKIPVLLNNIKRLTEKVQENEKAIAYQAQHHIKDLKAQNDRIRGEFETQMQAAVKEGDEDAYLEAKKGRDDVVDPSPAPTAPSQSPAEQAFINDNSWYQSDRAMTAYAQSESQRLASEFPNLTQEQNLARVKTSVETEFAHKFGNPRREEPGAVGSARKPGKSAKKGFADLPQDAQDACMGFHKQKTFGDVTLDEAKKAYLSTYQWDE